MPTIHNEAKAEEFADTVLMPGDPLRAKFIAETFLDDSQQVNQVRNMLAYTGYYQGHRISVMGSGMGIPSISLYAHELFTEYDVKRIIRVGSCGALQSSVNLGDIVIAMGACTDSGVNRQRADGMDFAAIADYELLHQAVQLAREQSMPLHVGNVFSTDNFYSDAPHQATFSRLGVLAAEMEAAGLYGVAAQLGKQALTIAMVSDHILNHTQLDATSRQTGFGAMIELALATVVKGARG